MCFCVFLSSVFFTYCLVNSFLCLFLIATMLIGDIKIHSLNHSFIHNVMFFSAKTYGRPKFAIFHEKYDSGRG